MVLSTNKLNWIDERRGTIAGMTFNLTVTPSEYHSIKSTSDEFLLIKTRDMLDTELATIRSPNPKIFEMGIWQGGSTVLFDLVTEPRKLVAVDFSPELDVLSQYIRQRRREDVLRPYFGVNQGDSGAIGKILAKEFPGRDIDLIIDDASHFYEETKVALNTAWPYLSPGGTYIIEDWTWSHSASVWKDHILPASPASRTYLCSS